MSVVGNKAITEKPIIIIINNKVTFIYIRFLFKLDVKNLSQTIRRTIKIYYSCFSDEKSEV